MIIAAGIGTIIVVWIYLYFSDSYPHSEKCVFSNYNENTEDILTIDEEFNNKTLFIRKNQDVRLCLQGDGMRYAWIIKEVMGDSVSIKKDWTYEKNISGNTGVYNMKLHTEKRGLTIFFFQYKPLFVQNVNGPIYIININVSN